MAVDVTVVVPVYNTGAYIAECVESLVGQSVGAPEIILVDDGSSDDSGAVCDRLAEKYPTLRVIHKQNGGAAMARYDGTQAVRTKYVAYIDSDDIAEKDFIEKLYAAAQANAADCVCCGYRKYFEKENRIDEPQYVASENISLNAAGTFETMFYDKKCFASVCCKLFLTDRIRRIEPMRIKLGEDSYVCIRYFLESDKIVHLNYAGLRYRQRADSAMHTADGVARYDYVRLYDALKKDFYEKCPAALPAFKNKFIEDNFVTLLELTGSSETEKAMRAHILANIKEYRRDVLRDPRAEKRTRAACALSFAGAGAVSGIYRLRAALNGVR